MSSSSRGGRRRSPIWEFFILGKNPDGNRVAQCTFCSRTMKSQPDRMENHFIKLCLKADAATRNRWVHDREDRESISSAAAALQHQRDDGLLGKLEDAVGGNNMLGLSEDGGSSLQAQVAAAAAAGDAHLRQQLNFGKVNHVVDNPELSTTVSSAPAKARKQPAGKGVKRQQLTPQPVPHQQQQQQRNGGNPHFSILKDVNGKTERVELENLRMMHAESELEGQTLELKRRKLELEERKASLQIESMRYDNDIKRIRVAEENMLARKRLRDAGVPQDEIDLLLPLQQPDAVDFKGL